MTSYTLDAAMRALDGHDVEQQLLHDDRGEVWFDARLSAKAVRVRFIVYKNGGEKQYHPTLEAALAALD